MVSSVAIVNWRVVMPSLHTVELSVELSVELNVELNVELSVELSVGLSVRALICGLLFHAHHSSPITGTLYASLAMCAVCIQHPRCLVLRNGVCATTPTVSLVWSTVLRTAWKSSPQINSGTAATKATLRRGRGPLMTCFWTSLLVMRHSQSARYCAHYRMTYTQITTFEHSALSTQFTSYWYAASHRLHDSVIIGEHHVG